jgi:16S rRNA (adenine1518-N6/adenine1519-N6)-dimethyltransferase
VILKTRHRTLVGQEYEKLFWRLVKAGFSAKRKKLRSSLAGGLNMQKTEVDYLLAKAGIDSSIRAEDLSIANWLEIAKIYKT